MNTRNQKITFILTPTCLACVLVATASLLLTPNVNAQSTASTAQENSALAGTPETDSKAKRITSVRPVKNNLYALKFERGNVNKLRDGLRLEFPSDNVVVSEFVEKLELPAFELRNVELAEIGRTIEFLSDGQLVVEVVENAGGGNIWRIGRKNPSETVAAVKTRSVAAPNLLSNEEALADILMVAENLQKKRRYMAEIAGSASSIRGASLEPLRSQSIFAIVGDEESVAGLESLIQVAEQAQAKAVWDLLREAPKMKAVAAPHVFAIQERVDRLLEEYRVMTAVHGEMTYYRWKVAGFGDGAVAFEAQIHPRPEADLFMLVGNPDSIAGLESLIQAAEQLAASEDAILDSRLTPQQRVEQAQVRAAVKAEARAKEKMRLEVKEKAEKEAAQKRKSEQ